MEHVAGSYQNRRSLRSSNERIEVIRGRVRIERETAWFQIDHILTVACQCRFHVPSWSNGDGQLRNTSGHGECLRLRRRRRECHCPRGRGENDGPHFILSLLEISAGGHLGRNLGKTHDLEVRGLSNWVGSGSKGRVRSRPHDDLVLGHWGV